MRSTAGPPAPVPVVIVNNANTTVADQSGGVYRSTKTGGVDTVWDADAVSSTGFAGDFIIRIQARQIDKTFMVAANADPTADSGYVSLDRALFFNGSGLVEPYASGGSAGAAVAYTASDRFFIKRAGAAITALKGPTDNIADAAALTTTWANLAGTLFVDSSFNSANAAADIYAVAA